MMDRDVETKDGYLKVNLEGEAGKVDVNLPQPIPDISITGITSARPPVDNPLPSPHAAQQRPPSPAPPPSSPAHRRESPRRGRSPCVPSAHDEDSDRGFHIDELVNPRKRRSPAPDREDGRSSRRRDRRDRSRSVTSRSESIQSSHAGRKGSTRDVQKPSPGFATLKEEKLHILLALRRMKEEGIKGITEFDPDSDIEEMRIELRAFEDDETVRTGIQTCRTALVTFSTGLEVANTKYDPFDLDLRGFSESVFARIERYDGVFERLVRKWSKRTSSMSPEMMLVMMFVGNAFAFCFTKSMMTPETASRVVADNPDVLKEMVDQRVREGIARARAEEEQKRETGSFNFFDPPRSTRGDTAMPPPQRAEVGGPGEGGEKRGRGPGRHTGRRERRERLLGKTRDEVSTSASSGSGGSEWSDRGKKTKRYDSERSVSSMETVEESVATTVPRPTTVTAKATVKKVPVGKAGAGGVRRNVVEIEL